jgi:hypothetical protein
MVALFLKRAYVRADGEISSRPMHRPWEAVDVGVYLPAP